MTNLYEILADAQQGKAMAGLGREFGLAPQQTEAAVTALLPAISVGLKQSTTTPEGLGDVFALMGRQPDLYSMYNDPDVAFSPAGRKAGNEILSAMFGSPDASRAVADQAQQYSGVTADVLKKLLPVLAGILISGLMRSQPGQAAPSVPQTSPADGGGGIGDILKEIFKKVTPESGGPAPSTPTPSNAQPQGGDIGSKIGPGSGYQMPVPGSQQGPTDSDGQDMPGDVLGQIMRELEKAAQEGRLKPVIIGPFEIDVPRQAGATGTDSGQPQTSGGDIFGQILRDILGGAGGQVGVPRQASALMSGAGTAVFGDRLEPGRKVDQTQLDSFQKCSIVIAPLRLNVPHESNSPIGPEAASFCTAAQVPRWTRCCRVLILLHWVGGLYVSGSTNGQARVCLPYNRRGSLDRHRDGPCDDCALRH